MSVELLSIGILVFVASLIGTLSGFGTSTIMVPVLLLFYPLAPTLLLVGIIHWFGDIWKIALFREGMRWRLIFLFGVPGVLLTFLGARLVFSVSETLLSQILGGFLVAYVAFLFFSARGGPASGWNLPVNALTAITGGALSGFFAGIFGVGGAIRGAFLSAFDLQKAVYIAAAGAIGLAIDTARIGTYVAEGAILPVYLFWGLLLFIPASAIGAYFAKRIVDKIPQKQFRTVVAVFLLAIGIKLLFYA